MTAGAPRLRWAVPDASATVVVPAWDTGSEAEVAVRALAGVLARTYRVDVVALRGAGRPPRRDGALQVVELTGEPVDATTRAVVRRALAEAATGTGRPADWLPEPAATVLGGPEAHAWQLAADHVAGHRPSVVVVAGTLDPGALEVLDAAPTGTTTVALPLCGCPAAAGSVDRTVLRKAGTVLATGPAEAAWLAEVAGAPVTEVGTHLPANPFAVREPPAMLPAGAYVAVVDAVTAVGDSALAHDRTGRRYGPTLAVGAWLQGALAPVPVAAVDGPDVITWQRGHAEQHTVVTSRSDLWRVLAFARAVVVVDPGPVLARSTLETMLHGTPVVVPAGSLAAGHVAAANAGLVVSSDAERLAALRALVDDPAAAATLGEAGQRWALPRYGDIDAYARRLALACGLPGPAPGEAAPGRAVTGQPGPVSR